MNKEKQRIKIAEACGYLNPRFSESGTCIASCYQKEDGSYFGTCGVLDFLNDLNAMQVAENTIQIHSDQKWVECIVNIALNKAHWDFDKSDGWDWVALVSKLSAAQRAEAFLRTLGLWEDTK